MQKFALLSALILLVRSCTAGAQAPEDLACFQKWGPLEFSSIRFDQYDKYFDNESFIWFWATGKYVGPADIEEYVKFGSTFNDLVVSAALRNDTGGYWGRTPEGLCKFYSFFTAEFTLTSHGGGAVIPADTMFKILFDPSTSKIREWYVHYSAEFLDRIFSTWDTTETAEYVCGVMENNCSSTWDFNNFTKLQDCVDKFRDLPLVDADNALDGRSKGCRIVHTTFAKENPKHCAHISIAPEADFLGKVKCQMSAGLPTDAHFTPMEIQAFETYMASQPDAATTSTSKEVIFVGSSSPLRAGVAAIFVTAASMLVGVA